MHSFDAANEQLETEFYAQVPGLTPEAIAAELQRLNGFAAHPADQPEKYREHIADAFRLRWIIWKGARQSDARLSWPYRRFVGSTEMALSNIQAAYVNKFGHAVLGDVMKANLVKSGGPPTEGASLWLALRWMWLAWLPFGGLMLLLWLTNRGFSVVVEVLSPWRFGLALACGPFGFLFYPSGEPAEQLVRGLRFAAFVLGTSLSGFAGTAYAQTGKPDKKDKDKQDDPYTLQLDARTSDAMNRASLRDGFLRTTLISPSGWLGENILTGKEGAWSEWFVVGYAAKRSKKFSFYPVAGATRNSAGATSLQGGAQIYYNTPRFAVLIPVAHYDHRLDKKVRTGVVIGQVFGKADGWRVGLDYLLRAGPDAPNQWSLGPLLGKGFGKRLSAEAAMLRNNLGEWRFRARFVQNFAW